MGAYTTWERALSMGSGYMASSEGFSSSAESAEVLMWEMCYLHVNATTLVHYNVENVFGRLQKRDQKCSRKHI